MTAITRILVPTDFSDTSKEAFTYAKTLANRFDASLHLAHAFEDPFTAAAFSELYAPLPLEFRNRLVTETERRLAEWLPADERRRLCGTAEIIYGPPARTITAYAGKLRADLIVMGTHGRGGMSHLLLGSVAERVVREAPCPVVTVREAPPRGVRRILVPTDFSDTADAALDHALLFAARFGASLQLLHVLADPFVTEGLAGEAYIAEAPVLRSALLQEAQNRLAQRVAPLKNTGKYEGWPGQIRVDAEVFFGHGARTIADYAEGFDLVVMGTHGRTGIAHLVMGSVAEKLVRTAPCPVLTVRPARVATEHAELVYDVEHLPA